MATAKKDPRGRKPSASHKKRVVSSRLDEADYAVFAEMREEEAAPLRAKGLELTESDFLRTLIYECAERRGRKMGAPSPAAAPESTRRPAPRSKAVR